MTFHTGLVSPMHYLRRKKLLPTPTNAPRYEMGGLHSHRRPVTIPAPLRPVDSPAARVITQPWT